MGDIHYYMHRQSTVSLYKDREHEWANWFFWIYYTCKVQKEVIEKGFFKKRTYELQEEKREFPIPVLLYGDGENFYEFFSQQHFGVIDYKRIKENRHVYINIVIDAPEWKSLHINTRWDYGGGEFAYEGAIEECSATIFLMMVKETLEKAAKVGLGEQDIREKMNDLFTRTKNEYAREQQELQRAEEERKHREDEAQRILESMLK